MVSNVYDFVYLDESTNQIAIRPRVVHSKSGDKTSVVWQTNSARDKSIEVDSVLSTDRDITIVTKKGESFQLVKLTVDLYRERVQSKVANSPEFVNDEELQSYFKNSNFYKTC